jgi:hypothetical protein
VEEDTTGTGSCAVSKIDRDLREIYWKNVEVDTTGTGSCAVKLLVVKSLQYSIHITGYLQHNCDVM